MWNQAFAGFGAPPPPNRPPGYQQQPPVRPEPLDWNLVSILDPAIIQKVRDYDSLQKVVTNFLAANFTPNCSKIITNPLALRLCQLLQLGFQFMDESQRELKKIVDNDAVYKQKMIAALKKLKIKLNQTEEKLKIKSIPYDKCPICSKKFKSLDYVDKHIITKHEELADCWECIRGRKKPEKEPELQLVLEEIARLRASIKQGNVVREENNQSQDQLWINSEQSRNTAAGSELDEAAQSLSESVKLWNQVNKFDIFNKPSTYVPPTEISSPQRPFFVEEKDINPTDDANAFALFVQGGDENNEEEENHEEEDDDDGDMPPSLPIPQVNLLQPTEAKPRIFNNNAPKDKARLIKAAKKFIYKPRKPVLDTAKKSEISDTIDHIKKQKMAQVKRFESAINGDAITPTFVRRNIAINDPDYADLRNYIQSRLEHEYPLQGDQLEPHPAPKIVENGESKPIELNLIKTGILTDKSDMESSHHVLSELTVSEIKEEFQDEPPSFSYETLEAPQSPTIISTAQPIINAPKEEPSQQISIVEEEILPKSDSDDYYSETGGLTDMPEPPSELFNHSPPDIKNNQPKIKGKSMVNVSPIEKSKSPESQSDSKSNLLASPLQQKKSDANINIKPKAVDNSEKHTEIPVKHVIEDQNVTVDDAPQDSLLELEQIFKPKSSPIQNIEDQNNSLLLQSNVLEELSSGSHSENEDVTSISQNVKMPSSSVFSPIQKKQVTEQDSISSILPPKITVENRRLKQENVPQIKTDFDNVLETISKSPPSKSSSSEGEDFSKPKKPIKIDSPRRQASPKSESSSFGPNPMSLPKQNQKKVLDEISMDSPLPPKKDILLTPPRVLPQKRRLQDPPKQLPILPVAEDEEFTFEESPKNSPVRSGSSFLSGSPRPHVSMDPSAMSPKRRQIKVVQEDLPIEPSTDISLEISDFHDEASKREDSMIEGSFSEEIPRPEQVELISGSPQSAKKKVKKVSKSQRKSSPRREVEPSSEISAIPNSSSGSISDDGSFNITEELRKLDEDHKNDIEEIASGLFMKSPGQQQPKSRLPVKQQVQLSEPITDDQSSFLLKNRVLLAGKSSAIDEGSTGFSLMSDKQTDSSILGQGAKHIRRSKKSKQITFGK